MYNQKCSYFFIYICSFQMDNLSQEKRSYIMSQIRSKDTKPEIILRKALFKKGLRYRKHHKLPGKPDIVFISKKMAIFVNGSGTGMDVKQTISRKQIQNSGKIK